AMLTQDRLLQLLAEVRKQQEARTPGAGLPQADCLTYGRAQTLSERSDTGTDVERNHVSRCPRCARLVEAFGGLVTGRRNRHMPTLVIHAPYSQVQQNDKKSFDETVSTGIGQGYAINRSLVQQLSPVDPVVVICKVHQKQAEGRIKQLRPTEKAGNGIQRY